MSDPVNEGGVIAMALFHLRRYLLSFVNEQSRMRRRRNTSDRKVNLIVATKLFAQKRESDTNI